jgi:23S rRNA (guanosine2251-2'-O)-methyltransferase
MSLVGGVHSVRAALGHGSDAVRELWVDRGRLRDGRVRRLLELAAGVGVPVHRVDRGELDALLPGVNHQGVAARVRIPAARDEHSLDALLDGLEEPPFLLVLDGVQDPHNLGACLRTADAAGVHAVVAPRERTAGLTPTACKVASGAAERVPFVQVTNLARTLGQLAQGRGVRIVGTAGEADALLYEADLRGPLALVMGGEEKGLRRLTRERCDELVRLPMHGAVESLNVSVAAGVCLFEALRQRSAAGCG